MPNRLHAALMVASRSSSHDSSDDPFAFAHRPPPDETAGEKQQRIANEIEADRISQQIDRALEAEAKEKRRRDRGITKMDVLLLGPTEAGKSTFLRQLRLQYDAKGLDAEREALRLVILLSLVASVKMILDLFDAQDANDDTPLGDRSSTPNSRDPKTPRELAARRRLRLAPFLALEQPLREALDVSATGSWAESMAAHAASPPFPQQDVNYRDSLLLEDIVNSSDLEKRRVRTRTNSRALAFDPVLAPGRLAQLVSTVGFGSGKESRRARAQSSSGSQNWSPDGTFLANKDDPIHLVGALKSEIQNVWSEARARGMIFAAVEGEDEDSTAVDVAAVKEGAVELSESSRYFLNQIDRIATPTWLPSDRDLLKVRIRTRGIETHELRISSHQIYRICDVAGVRGVKHAWAPYFEGMSAIIFICAISDYNFCDPADPKRNRLDDALLLFRDICKNRLLRNADMITFMNKVDVLRRKVRSGKYPLERYFPAYKGTARTMDILSFVQGLFEEAHRSRKRPFFIFATQANEARSIQTVTAAVNDILLRTDFASNTYF